MNQLSASDWAYTRSPFSTSGPELYPCYPPAPESYSLAAPASSGVAQFAFSGSASLSNVQQLGAGAGEPLHHYNYKPDAGFIPAPFCCPVQLIGSDGLTAAASVSAGATAVPSSLPAPVPVLSAFSLLQQPQQQPEAMAASQSMSFVNANGLDGSCAVLLQGSLAAPPPLAAAAAAHGSVPFVSARVHSAEMPLSATGCSSSFDTFPNRAPYSSCSSSANGTVMMAAAAAAQPSALSCESLNALAGQTGAATVLRSPEQSIYQQQQHAMSVSLTSGSSAPCHQTAAAYAEVFGMSSADFSGPTFHMATAFGEPVVPPPPLLSPQSSHQFCAPPVETPTQLAHQQHQLDVYPHPRVPLYMASASSNTQFPSIGLEAAESKFAFGSGSGGGRFPNNPQYYFDGRQMQQTRAFDVPLSLPQVEQWSGPLQTPGVYPHAGGPGAAGGSAHPFLPPFGAECAPAPSFGQCLELAMGQGIVAGAGPVAGMGQQPMGSSLCAPGELCRTRSEMELDGGAAAFPMGLSAASYEQLTPEERLLVHKIAPERILCQVCGDVSAGYHCGGMPSSRVIRFRLLYSVNQTAE